MRSRLSGVAALAIAGAALAGWTGCSGEPLAPNVVLVSLDTVRADHLPFHGYARDTMPALSAFAKRGAVFESAFAQAPSTVPTHASIFTGRFPFQHRTYGFPQSLPESERTLAEFLRERGYRTFAIASSVRFIENAGFAQGFDFYQSLHDLEKVDRSAEVTRMAVAQAAQDPDRPFFAFLHYFDAHTPYAPPPRYRTRWHPGRPDPAPEQTTEWLRAHRHPKHRIDADSLAYLVALYDASLRYLDDAVSELLSGIGETSNGRPTLWVITSDHGEEFKDHGGFLHSKSLFQELLHVPLLIVYADAIAPGTRIAQSAQSVDLFPTIAELAVGEIPERLAGVSRAASLRGDTPAAVSDETPSDVVVLERVRHLGVVATLPEGRFKWFESPRSLYALDRDPGEQENLADRMPKIADALERLPRRLGVPPLEVRMRGYLNAQREYVQAQEEDAVAERLRALGYVEEVQRPQP